MPDPSQRNSAASLSHRSEMSPARFSVEQSAQIIACIERWMRCASVTSTYELALIVSIPRGTLQRWLTYKVRLPFSGAKQIVDGLAEHAKRTAEAQQALADLTQLCPISDPLEERLRTEFRARGARFKSAMAAIEAAGLRLVPIDEPADKEQSQSNTLGQSRETTNEDSPAA